jgi:hypothetical protein
MSQEKVIEVIQKALMDEDFRKQLLNQPAEALKGYELTGEETQALSGIKKETFDAFASQVEERISKSGLSPNMLGKEPAIFQDPSYFNALTYGGLIGKLR